MQASLDSYHPLTIPFSSTCAGFVAWPGCWRAVRAALYSSGIAGFVCLFPVSVHKVLTGPQLVGTINFHALGYEEAWEL